MPSPETLGPADELDAVNEMLAAVKQAPITSLTSPIPPVAVTALTILRRTSRKLQEEGWHFNTEENVTLLPDGSGNINLPSDALKILPLDNAVSSTADVDVTERARKLYNRATNTFVWTSGVTVNLVRHLGWADLPSHARHYITALAIRTYSGPNPGADVAMANQQNLMDSLRAFKQAEAQEARYNVLTDSFSVSSILLRSGLGPYDTCGNW